MITKEYMQKELARRIAGIRPNVPTNTDVLIGELKSVLVMVDCLPGEISEKPINPEEAMKELDEKIALVKQRGTWDGVDVDKYMDEVRGREPEKPMNQDGLDEEIERYLHSLGVGYGGWVDGMDDEDLRGIARHFAQWGADHTPLPEDTVLFNKGVAEGRRLESEENKDRDIVFWRGIQYAKEQMLKDGLDAVKTLDFNKAEKTIAGVFVKYGMDRQKEIMSNGDYEKIKRLLSIAFMHYLDSNRPFGKMCLSNGECKNIDDAFDNQDWSELCRYADKMLKMNELGNTPADKNYKPSGISRAEERAMVAYPRLSVASVCIDGTTPVDLNTGARKRFQEGYEQAEKDLALTWKDIKIIVKILADSDWYDFEINGKLWSQEFYEEVLKRFKEAKK